MTETPQTARDDTAAIAAYASRWGLDPEGAAVDWRFIAECDREYWRKVAGADDDVRRRAAGDLAALTEELGLHGPADGSEAAS
jgi:hypothetical protein